MEDDPIRAYQRANGRKGGKARAKLYTAAQLSAWAAKGGRPRKKPGAKKAK